jgi:hypothetical protein
MQAAERGAQRLFAINSRGVRGAFQVSSGCCGVDVAGIRFGGGFVLREV